MAETSSLLNCRSAQVLPGVRIPLSPQEKEHEIYILPHRDMHYCPVDGLSIPRGVKAKIPT